MKSLIHPWARNWIRGWFAAGVLCLSASVFFPGSLFLGIGLAAMGIMAVFLFFFRNPGRSICLRDDSLVCPADGRVIDLQTVPADGEAAVEKVKISIFLALWNVHVIRSPLDARVVSRGVKQGAFYPAFLKRAENQNRSLSLRLMYHQVEILMQLKAGFIARQILCGVLEGNRIRRGEIIGLIRFGSRVDLYLPADFKPVVKKGDKVKAGNLLGMLHAA